MEEGSSVLSMDDKYFLLYFIMGAYFGPDLKGGRPNKSALQRQSQGLAKYNQNDLVGSHMKTEVLESIYSYVLRSADETVIVQQPSFLEYINGSLQDTTYPQFDYLFPPELHQLHHDTIDNIIFIHNPEIDYLNTEEIERFKRLTRLNDFILDRESAMAYTRISLYAGDQCLSYSLWSEPLNSAMPFTCSPSNASPKEDLDHSRGMIFLPSCPSKEEWSNLVASVKHGFGVTGSAARGQVGPVLGLVDIGESEDSYLFRVSLPGVKRDERDFSCEVENDGRVIIKGVTVSGERSVEKYSQIFDMLTHNLCPPGAFSITFELPGPVDPSRFHGNFASDGILEGIAIKATGLYTT